MDQSSHGINAATAALFAATEKHGFQDPVRLPRDAKLLSLLIQSENVPDYDTKVIPQLLEFMHRYVLDVVSDAQTFSEHASRKDINLEDIKLAIGSKVGSSFTSPPGRTFNAQLADELNQRPLPPIPSKFGVRLPPDQYTLTSTNFQIAVETKDNKDNNKDNNSK